MTRIKRLLSSLPAVTRERMQDAIYNVERALDRATTRACECLQNLRLLFDEQEPRACTMARVAGEARRLDDQELRPSALPASGPAWEQLLGRLRRAPKLTDTATVTVAVTTTSTDDGMCGKPVRYRVSWSDRELFTCEEHLADARWCAANDSSHDRTNHPDVTEDW